MTSDRVENPQDLEDELVNFLKEKNLQTLDEAVQIISQNYSLKKEEIIRMLKNLQSTGKLNLTSTTQLPPRNFKAFLFHPMNRDFWASVILVVTTVPVTLLIPENALESGNGVYIVLGVIRLLLGVIFVVFLPGYALCTILWPTTEKEDLTRYGISFGLSIAIAPLLGLVLNFTPFGLTIFSILVTLLIFTLILLFGGLIRRFRAILR
jgi:hypothetical protein